jgi:serine/threonine protein kinase
VRDLLLRMLDLDNGNRISAVEALEHELFISSVKTPSLTSTDTEVETPKIVPFG